jgi:hypothetical protein
MRLVFGIAYVLMGTFGVAALLSVPQAETDADRYLAVFAGGLFALIGIGGLAMVLFVPLFHRYRPGPVLSTAPSGAPAMLFRRSPFMTVVSVVFCLVFALWAGALGVVLYGYGHGVWASLLVALALVLLWPVAVIPTGKIKPGGLWLTPVGLEYRKDAVSWTSAWSDLDGLDRTASAVQKGVLPYASGLGVAAVEPLVLALRLGARLEVRRSVWWVWSRECRVAPGTVCIDCFDLAGGSALVAETIERYRTYPRTRDQLGTEWSLPRRAR